MNVILQNWKILFLICIVGALAALVLSGCKGGIAGEAASEGEEKGHRKISQDEAMRIMNEEEDFILVDVRTPDEYISGYIPGAINIPNEIIGEEEIPQLPDKNQRLLIYCRSGNRSNQAGKKLEKLGYTEILDFGGIMTWKGEIVTP